LNYSGFAHARIHKRGAPRAQTRHRLTAAPALDGRGVWRCSDYVVVVGGGGVNIKYSPFAFTARSVRIMHVVYGGVQGVRETPNSAGVTASSKIFLRKNKTGHAVF